MAEYYNDTGALKGLLNKLSESVNHEFKSLDDVHLFLDKYEQIPVIIRKDSQVKLYKEIAELEAKHNEMLTELKESISKRKVLIKKEIEDIDKNIYSLGLHNNKILNFLFSFLKKRQQKKKIKLENNFEEEVKHPFRKLGKKIDILKLELEDKKNNQEKWIEKLSASEIDRAEILHSAIERNKSLFFGAEGEEKALNELIKLPESYFIINDYCRHFNSPVYDRRNDDKIFSIQLDHIVIGPTGIFLVETKNWSKESMENLDLFSPVKQLKRHSFAMFCILNRAIRNNALVNFNNGWGERKISPRNIILLMNHKPVKKFQHVELLSLPEIDKYITHGQKIFSKEEVEELVDYLNSNNENY